MTKNTGINFENTYLELDNRMYSIIEPNNIEDATLELLNTELANELGIDCDYLRSREGISLLSGNNNKYGNLYSQAYGGHQYGNFTMLGDGRAVVLGELLTKDNSRYDIQLKGSGKTPYSRGGDGKGTLYSMLREYLISEAMHALKVPTTRSLAVVKTNETIQRSKIEQGGILTRVASSHIRVGTFEYARVYGDKHQVKKLADYVIDRHFRHLNNAEDKYTKLLREVVRKQAYLIAKWQSIGFIHGVLNTDNVLISGETIDYGPCAFMDIYEPKTVFSSIDSEGRYAYQNQPYIGSWNLSRFAESILDLLDDSQEESIKKANNELRKFGELYDSHWLTNMSLKLGIKNPTEEDKIVVDELLNIMKKYKSDFTNTFSLLTQNKFESINFYNTSDWIEWFKKWTRALGYRRTDTAERINIMKQSNPIIIPRNSIVEEALINASTNNDYTLYNDLLYKLKNPFNDKLIHADKYIVPVINSNYKTFCGT